MLDLRFKLCQDKSCKELVFVETTGVYDSLLNLGGGGSPNPTTASASNITLSVTFPDATTGSFTFPAGWPTTDNSKYIIIKNTDLGLVADDSFDDGQYTFTYSITSGTIVYTKAQDIYFFCQVRCCVNKMVARIGDSNCQCEKDYVDNVLWASALLHSLEYAAICNKKNQFDNIMEYLTAICDTEPCDCD